MPLDFGVSESFGFNEFILAGRLSINKHLGVNHAYPVPHFGSSRRT